MRSKLAAIVAAALVQLTPLWWSRAFAYQVCVNNKTGVVRVVLRGGSCKKAEAAMNMAPEVVDANGHDVGPLSIAEPADEVLLQINGIEFTLPVFDQGFPDTAFAVSEYFTASDCSSTPYLAVDTFLSAQQSGAPLSGFPLHESADNFSGSAFVSNHVLYYAAAPLQQMTFQSQAYFSYFSGPSQLPSDCYTNTPSTVNAGPMATFDLSTLGFTAPFHLQ
jgi:hypothetical protein